MSRKLYYTLVVLRYWLKNKTKQKKSSIIIRWNYYLWSVGKSRIKEKKVNVKVCLHFTDSQILC